MLFPLCFSQRMLGSRPTKMPLAFPSPTTTLPRLPQVMVSAKVRRRRRSSPQFDADEGEDLGDVGFAVLTALESDAPRQEDRRQPEVSRGEEKKGGASLRGSDVLIALQKAAAEKANRNKGKKGLKGKRTATEGMAEDGYSDARPLNIKSDWGFRLDEMERILEELKREEESA